jgi:hypothetical protein
MEDILFARKGTTLTDAMTGRGISRRKALAMRQLLVDTMPDSQEYAAAFDSALV